MAYRDEVLTDAPLDYYEMETSTGTDSGSGGKTLTLNGGITTGATGKVSKGWSFDGVNDYATIAAFPSLTAAFSFEAWVKAPSAQGMAGDYHTIIRRDGTDIGLLRVRGSNVTGGVNPGQAEVFIDGTTLVSGSSYRVDDGNWHHLVYTQSGNAAKLYIDGVLRASATTAQTTFNFGTGAGYIGAANGTGEYFKGIMDEVAVYNTALSAARISAHYDGATKAVVDADTPTASALANDVTVESNATISVIDPSYDAVWQTNDKSVGQADSEKAGSATATSLDIRSTSNSVTSSGNEYGVLRFTKTDVSPANSTVSSSKLRVFVSDRLTSSGTQMVDGVTMGLYVWSRTGSSYTQQASVSTSADDTWYEFDVTAAVQYAVNNLSTVEFRLVEDSSGSIKIASDESANKPQLQTFYTTPVINIEASVDTPSVTVAAVEATTATTANVGVDLTPAAFSVQAAEATVQTTASVSTDLDTAQVSVSAAEATAEATTDPTVIVDVETARVSAQAIEASVSLPVIVEVSETPSVQFSAPQADADVTNSAVVDLDTPSVTLRAVKPTDVNGEPIVASETEDPYFVSTLRSTTSDDIWWRFNEVSGTKIANRANPSAEWPGTGTGTYEGVVIGQSKAPEGRRSVYFNGTARTVQNEPTGTNQDETYGTPRSLEFSIRTDKQNAYLMGGVDLSRATAEGLSAGTTGPYEFWIVDGKLVFRHFNMAPAYTGQTGLRQDFEMKSFGNVADGEWHHIVINAGELNQARGTSHLEFYVDGKLDIRRVGAISGFGFPDVIGGRGSNYTGWPAMPGGALNQASWYVGDMSEIVLRNFRPLSPDDISLQRDNFFGIIPVYAETAKATVNAVEATAKGNKTRLLVIDFQTAAFYQASAPYPGVGPRPGSDAFGKVLTAPPHTFAFNFSGLQSLQKDSATYFPVPEPYQFFTVKARDGYFDEVTDNERVLDLSLDVNMEDYDLIALSNFPQTDSDWAWFDVLDDYAFPPFVPARQQVEKLLADVREQSIVHGKGLFINDPESARIMGLIDRYEPVANMRETVINDQRVGSVVGLYDAHAANINPFTRSSPDRYRDEHSNQRQRVRKTVEGLTTIPSYIITDYIEWYATDPMSTPPMNEARKVENRPDGLNIGDEFYMHGSYGPGVLDWADAYDGTPTSASRGNGWVAAPMANVKVGSVVTSFSAKVQNLDKIEDNPYRDYAVSVVVEPGDMWDGRPTQGKVYMNFTEAFTDLAMYFETSPVQDLTKPLVANTTPEPADKQAWNFSTWRGTWTGSTINPNNASGGSDISTNNNGGLEGGATTGQSKQPNVTSLVTFVWKSAYQFATVETLQMANRGLRWLASGTATSGNANVSVETPTASVKAVEATAATTASVVVDVSTPRVRTEAYADADTVVADATVLVDTAEFTASAGAFREVIDLTTATVSVAAVEIETNVLENLQLIRLVLPRHTVKLIMEE